MIYLERKKTFLSLTARLTDNLSPDKKRLERFFSRNLENQEKRHLDSQVIFFC